MATKVSTSRSTLYRVGAQCPRHSLIGRIFIGFSWGSAILIPTTVKHMIVSTFQGPVQAVVTSISTMGFLLFLVVYYGAKVSYDA